MNAALHSAVGRGVRRRAPRRGGRSDRHGLAALVFLSPALVIITAFIFLPLLLTLWISFHRWSMLTPLGDMKWTGVDNYVSVFTGSTHLTAFINTAVYVGLSVLITVPMALLIAMLLYFPRLRGRGVVQVILFSTYVIPTVAIVIIWSQLYSPQYGPVDNILHFFGIASPGWLSNPNAALISLIIFNVWQMLGYYVVLLVAGLTQIPQEVYEAARLDGASAFQQAVSVTIPLLRSSLVFVILMTVVNSIQVFDPVYLLTQGGPVNSTLVLSFDIQRTAFQNGLAGEASAMAFSLLFFIALVGGTLAAASRRHS